MRIDLQTRSNGHLALSLRQLVVRCLAMLRGWAVAAGAVALAILTVPLSLFGASAGFQPAPFDFAAYATGTGCGALNFSGGAYTDSFDSSQGNYAQTKQLGKANVGVTGNINLSGQSTVNGIIFALNTTVGACQNGKPGITLSGSAKATGGYLQLSAAPVFPNPPSVTPGAQNYNLSANTSLPPGSYNNVSMSGGKTLTFSPGTYNINSIALSGGSVLTVSPAGQVIVNVAGNSISQPINFSGGTIVNPSEHFENAAWRQCTLLAS